MGVLPNVDWNQRWGSLSNPDQQVTETFDTGISDVNSLKNMIGNVMKFGLVEDNGAITDLLGDVSTPVGGNTVMGCSQLRTGAMNQSGEKINVGSSIPEREPEKRQEICASRLEPSILPHHKL